MRKRDRPSSKSYLEKLLEDWLAEDESDERTVSPITPPKPETESITDGHSIGRRTVVELVESDERLQAILRRMLHLKFLLIGPVGYLRDTTRIERAWKRSQSQNNALAMGIHLYDEFFFEGINAVRQKGDFAVSSGTKKKLKKWEKEVGQLFTNESKEIVKAALHIGQYLEFTNRKAQGF